MTAQMETWMPWVQALGWTLLHFVWQGLVIGAGFAAARTLLPKAHCTARYAAGLVALALLAVWPLATFIALRPQGVADADPGIALAPAGMTAVATMTAESVLAATISHALPWLVLLWGVGVLAMAGRAVREWRALTRITREWADSNAELDAMLRVLTRRFGFVRRVRVLVSACVDTPMLIGWLKPVILLPTAVALGFPRQQVELILAHELGHLRRYDHLVNLGQALLETLLFYHPVVHWISREVRNERELCCDELVLRQTRGDPRDYARTLAALEDLRQVPASLALAANGGELLERVRRIVGVPAPRSGADSRGGARWLMLIAALGMALVTAMRVGRDEGPFIAPDLSIGWVAKPDMGVLPLAALTFVFERPRLRLAPISAQLEPSPAESALPAAALAAATPAVDGGATTPGRAASILPTAATPLASREVASLIEPSVAVSMPAPPVEPVRIESVAPAKKPVALHTVAPKFPAYARREAGRVEASFTIAADGSVNDLRFAQDGAGAAFVRAADRALRQWRFDPATLPADRAARYTQTFVFAPGRTPAKSREDCVQTTGSLICRDPSDALAKESRFPSSAAIRTTSRAWGAGPRG